MAEDQLWHINLLLLVDLHRDPIPTVVHANQVLLHIDRDFNRVHPWVPLLVIGSIDQDLIKDLVKAGDVGHGSVDHLFILIDPQGLGVLLYRANVGVRAEEDVLELRFLLVGLLDGLLWAGGDCRGYVDGVAALQREFLGRCHGLWRVKNESLRFRTMERERERERGKGEGDTEMVSRLLID